MTIHALRPVVARGLVLVALGGLALGCKRSEAAPPQGRELFATTCARCHGTEGNGGVASAVGPQPRNFRDHDFQMSRTDEQLKQTIRNGKGSGMPPFGTLYDDAQLSALVATIRSFDAEKR